MKTRALKIVVLLVLTVGVVLGRRAVLSASEGCVFWQGTCIDTEFCCIIPGQCENECRPFTDHCHCVPVG